MRELHRAIQAVYTMCIQSSGIDRQPGRGHQYYEDILLFINSEVWVLNQYYRLRMDLFNTKNDHMLYSLPRYPM